ncbi:MAG: hypothetical protein IPQ19_15500 [Bacteroidetes bacterium]|nr:hypothetical protein [Bacteroidota bacterium]
MKSIFITFLLLYVFKKSKSQEIKQVFVGEIIQEDTIPLIGATLFWLNSTIGATTNEKGIAELECIGKYPNKLVLNYLGTKPILLLFWRISHFLVFSCNPTIN